MALDWVVSDFHAGTWSFLVAGIVHLCLCALVLAIDFSSRLHRAAGLYLFLMGGSQAARVLDGAAWAEAGGGLGVYMAVGSVFALFHLAACYHDRYGRRKVARFALPLLLVAAAVAEAMLATHWPASAFQAPRPWFGAILFAIQISGLSLLAALFLRDAVTPRVNTTQSRQLVLAAVGLVFFPLAYGPHTLLEPLMPITAAYRVVYLATTVPAIAVVLGLVRLARSRGPLQATARAGLKVLGLPVLTVLLLALANQLVIQGLLGLAEARRLMLVVMSFWPTATAAILVYAILRGEIFGVPARLKWTIRRGTVATILLAVFFVVAQLAEAYVARLFGGSQWVLGGIGAGLALFALTPLQDVAARVAEAAMPGVKPVREMSGAERAQAFREQLEAAWSDGAINAKERRMLEVARQALGVSHEEAARMEHALLAAPVRGSSGWTPQTT